MSDEDETGNGMEPQGAVKGRPLHEPDAEGTEGHIIRGKPVSEDGDDTEGHSVRDKGYGSAPPAHEADEPGPQDAIKLG